MTRPNKIINVRGTSGSGKTTLIRGVLTKYPFVRRFFYAGRKQPLYYIYSGAKDVQGNPIPDLALLGHYESACGGCDTISKYLPDLYIGEDGSVTCGFNEFVKSRKVDNKTEEDGNSYDTIFGLVRTLFMFGYDVLFEGLLISGDMARTKQMWTDCLNVHIVALNIPIEECLTSVIGRRAAKGNEKEFNPKNTIEKHKLLNKCLAAFKAANMNVYDMNTRGEAMCRLVSLLGISMPLPTELQKTLSFEPSSAVIPPIKLDHSQIAQFPCDV